MKISEIAYELYKQDWIDSNVTQEVRLNTFREYILYTLDCISNNEYYDSFDEWVWEVGYGNGSIYVCYDEFCDMEYCDEGYIRYLLKDDKLIDMYYADVTADD